MLAKELKIKTLKKQREFIKKQLANVDYREDGNTSYSYVGYIHPEVIKYFEEEGFNVTLVNNDMVQAVTHGAPMYIFTIKDDIELNEEEMKEAEAYEPENPDDATVEFLKGIFNCHGCDISDDDCDEENCDCDKCSEE